MDRRPRSGSVSSVASGAELVEKEGNERMLSTTPQQVRPVTALRHNSIVAAMLTSNALRDCNQVQDMVTKCVSDNEKSFMCQTAHRYFAKCAGPDL